MKMEEKEKKEQLKTADDMSLGSILLVLFFVILSLSTVFGFRYWNRYNTAKIDSFFLKADSKKDGKELIKKKFREEYWEPLKKIVDFFVMIAGASFVVYLAILVLKKSVFKKINTSEVSESLLICIKDLLYGSLEKRKFFALLAEKDKKKLEDFGSQVRTIKYEINELQKNLTPNNKSIINEKNKEANFLLNKMSEISYKISNVLSKKNIFDIFDLFLKSDSISVNPFCDSRINCDQNVFSVDNKIKKVEEYICQKEESGEPLLELLEDRYEDIFFDGEFLDDDEERIKCRVKKAISLYEKEEKDSRAKILADRNGSQDRQDVDIFNKNEVANILDDAPRKNRRLRNEKLSIERQKNLTPNEKKELLNEEKEKQNEEINDNHIDSDSSISN